MQFLNPTFLWALGLVSIPILIHLFNFQRLKKISFTNVKWLEEIKITSKKSRNLKHYLILLSRILAISMLVLAFSQPVLPPKKNLIDAGNWDRVFFQDNSFSMELVGETGGLTEGRKTMSELVEGTNFPGDYFFFDNAFSPSDEYPYQKEPLLERFSSLDYSLSFKKGKEIIEKANNYPPGSRRKEIWMFSDFQKNSIGDYENWDLDSTNEYFLVALQTEGNSNYFIDSVWLERPFIEIGNTFVLSGLLKVSGPVTGDQVNIRLLVDGNQRASKSVIVENGVSVPFSFETSLERPGDFKCQLEIADEGISVDNQFRFVLSPLGGINVVEFGLEPNPYLGALFKSEPAFQHRFMTFGNPDINLLGNADLVLLHDHPSFQQLPDGFLNQYVSQGGHLVIIPASDSASGSLQVFLNGLGMSTVSQMSFSPGIKVAPLKEGDPFFEGVFEDVDRRMDLPEIDLNRELLGWETPVLVLRNEKAFLAYSDLGLGRIYLFGSPLSEEYGNFVKHSLFVPVLFRMGAFSRTSQNDKLFQRFDRELLSVRIDQDLNGQLVKLKSENREIIPVQRLLGKNLLLSTEGLQIQPGFLDISLNDTIIGTIAINTSSKESIIENASMEELEEAFSSFSNVSIFDGQSSVQISKSYNMDFVGRPLWKYCLIFALVFLLTETLIIRFL